MKKCLYLVLFVLILGMGTNKVKAECSNGEKNALGAKAVNMSYRWEPAEREIAMGQADGEPVPIMQTYIKVLVYNMTEDLRLVVSNSRDNNKLYFTYDGVISFDSDDIKSLVTYRFEVYAADGTCTSEVLAKNEISLPKYNELSYYELCDTTPDFYLCQQFVRVDKTFDEFINERDNYIARLAEEESEGDDNKGLFKSIASFLNKYKFVIIGVVAVAGAGTYIVIKKKGKKVV